MVGACTCENCGPGTFQTGIGVTHCSLCGLGTYQTGYGIGSPASPASSVTLRTTAPAVHITNSTQPANGGYKATPPAYRGTPQGILQAGSAIFTTVNSMLVTTQPSTSILMSNKSNVSAPPECMCICPVNHTLPSMNVIESDLSENASNTSTTYI